MPPTTGLARHFLRKTRHRADCRPGTLAGMHAAAPRRPRDAARLTVPGTALAALITAAVAVSLLAAAGEARSSGVLVPRLPWPLLLLGLTSLAASVAAAWTLRAQRPAAVAGLGTAVLGALLPLWATSSSAPGVLRAALLAATPLCVGGIAHLGRERSTGGDPASRRLQWLVQLLVAAAVSVHLLAFNPFADPGCWATCVAVRPPLASVLPTREAAVLAALLTVAAAGIAGAAQVRSRASTTSPVVRAAVVASLGALAVTATLRVVTWGDPQLSAMLPVLELCAVGAVAAASCAAAAQAWGVRRAVDRVVVGLSSPEPGAADLEGVHFAMPDGGGWVDGLGRPAPPGVPEHRSLVLSDRAGPVVRLPLRGDRGGQDALSALGPAGLLALDNARLSAVSRAQVRAVVASQRRIVAASDAERQRIERDLHDGAQQRLVSASFHLHLALGEVDAVTATALVAADQEVRTALAHLRRLAHGVFPGVLAQEGLAAALEDLVADSDVPATLDVVLGGAVSQESAMAAYQTAAAALQHVVDPAQDSVVHLAVREQDAALLVRAAIDAGRGTLVLGDLVEVMDRVGATGGRLDRTVTGSGASVLTAVIPCGS